MGVLLSAIEGGEILIRHGLPLAPQAIAATSSIAVEAAGSLGFPVALKIIAKGLSHKSDQGGVVLNLATADAVEKAAQRLLDIGRSAGDPEATILVQPMFSGVAEMIIGIKRDPVFGPAVLVGLGGIHTELYQDVGLRLAPVTPEDADEMLLELRAAPLLEGFRGTAVADRPALVELICAVARMATELPIEEMDLNPVLVRPAGSGCVILDNRMVMTP